MSRYAKQFEIAFNDEAAYVLHYWELGAETSGPTIYLQAGLHADEIAGMLVLHKLVALLADEQKNGRLTAKYIVVPQCNPIGIQQLRYGRLAGRFFEPDGRNFNRGFDLSALEVNDGFQAWQRSLLSLSCEADIVLDLHTDDEASAYLYVLPEFLALGQSLARHLEADMVLAWERDKVGSFEEVIADRFIQQSPGRNVFTSTIELRGQRDVSCELAEKDARALLNFSEALITDFNGQAAGVPSVPTYPTRQIEVLIAPFSGVLCFQHELGQHVEAGEVVATIIERPGDPRSEVELVAPQSGFLLTRFRDRYVGKGSVVAKIASREQSASWILGPLDA